MLHSLIAQLVIFVFSTVASALDKMVRLSVRFNGLDLNITYCFLPILKFLLYTSKSCFLIGFGFFVDEQGKMVKKPQVGEILFIYWYNLLLFSKYHFYVALSNNYNSYLGINILVVFHLQNLNVRIGAHVEIGANTCIDRGRWALCEYLLN